MRIECRGNKPDCLANDMEITDREVGRWEQTLTDVQHRARNDRQVINFIEADLDKLKAEVAKLKSTLWAFAIIAMTVGGVFAWVAEMIIEAGD